MSDTDTDSDSETEKPPISSKSLTNNVKDIIMSDSDSDTGTSPPSSKSITNDVKVLIAKDYLDNKLSQKELASKYSCSITSVRRYIKCFKNGLPMNEKGKTSSNSKLSNKLTVEQKIEIGNKYLQGGVTITELAKEYKCSISSVSSYINTVKEGKESTIRSNRGGNYKKGNKRVIIDPEVKIKIANEYLKGGINQKELAKKYDCSIGSVHYYVECVKNNLPMKQAT